MDAQQVVAAMMKEDSFSRWLGIEVLDVRDGYCKLRMQVRKEMLNGFGIAHGGITYSVADSALAFASNSKGRKCLSIETSISHVKSLKENDSIIAEAQCETETEKIGYYNVSVVRDGGTEPVALFKGLVYKTSKYWE
jgi:acyl-CoA thioesterase